MLTGFMQAVAGNDITGRTTGTLLNFLKEPALPVYYKMKAYLALSGADEEEEPWENFAACRYYLRKAEEALKEAQDIYVTEDRDVDVLQKHKRIIQEEWQELRQRERLAGQVAMVSLPNTCNK
jgi:hypothetical protein